MRKSKIAIIIPAYNEEKVIGQVIRDMTRALNKAQLRHQIIVVDDGSTDATAQKANQAGAYVIKHIINMGCGAATATGLSYARRKNFQVVATADADGQHAADDIITGINLLTNNSNYDLLVGSRLLDTNDMSLIKLIGNKGLSIFTNLLFGLRVTDSQSGLRIFSSKAIAELDWKSLGFEFCSEMLWRAKQNKMTIVEYPIKALYTDYSVSKGQNNWNGFYIVRHLWKRRLMELFSE